MSIKKQRLLTEERQVELFECFGAIPGAQGADGRDGCDGETGKTGPAGKQGKRGDIGPQGKEGKEGPEGRQGEPGCDGEDGKDGRAGRDGKRGPEGRTGPIGKTGLKGKDGCDGRDGKDGPKGEKGEPGRDGCDGRDGKDGCDGKQGEQGIQGARGYTGAKGSCGPVGPTGKKGDTGATGPAGKSAYIDVKKEGDCKIKFNVTQDDRSECEIVDLKTCIEKCVADEVESVLDDAIESGIENYELENPTPKIEPCEVCWEEADIVTLINETVDTTGGTGVGCCNTGIKASVINGTLFLSVEQSDGITVNTDVALPTSSGGTGSVVTCTTGSDANGNYQEILVDGQSLVPACRIYDGADGAPGANGLPGADGANGLPGADGANGLPGADGANGLPGADGINGTNGADGTSPTITKSGIGGAGTEADPYTGLNITINNNDGTPAETCVLSTTGTTTGGITLQEVIDQINLLNCCNENFQAPVTNADGSITYTLTQTNGSPVSFTIPAPVTSTSGCCNTQVTGPVFDANGDLVYTIVQEGGQPVSFTVPAPTTTTAGCCNTQVTGPVTDANGDLVYTIVQQGGQPVSFTVPAPTTTTAGCCNTQVNGPVTNANGDLVYTIVQDGGQDVSFTIPVVPQTGGLDKAAVQACVNQTLAALRVDCIETAAGFSVQLVNTAGAVVVPAGDPCLWPVVAPGSSQNIAWTLEADPLNPCVERVRFTGTRPDGSAMSDCVVDPYVEPECCTTYCVKMTAGSTLNISLSSPEGYTVEWGDNSTTNVGPGTSVATSHTYTNEGTYPLRVCLENYCLGSIEAEGTDFTINGFQELKAKGCG